MISLSGIGRVFQVGEEQVQALKDIDLELPGGSYTSIMGPSGSGKSTLLHILGLLDRPSQGLYRLEGLLTTDLDDRQQAQVRRHKIGFVFQAFHLISRLTAAENVELPMVLAGVPPGERRQRVEATLETLGPADRARHRPHQLSGGQRQRIAIARAIIMRPRLILADEPTGNLDQASGKGVIEALEQLHHQGMTLILVTHDPALAARAGRCLRMADGAILSDTGSP